MDTLTEWREARAAFLGLPPDSPVMQATLNRLANAEEALFRDGVPEFPLGTVIVLENDNFVGTCVGYYKTREGKRGVVLQQEATQVLRTYGVKRIVPPETSDV